jgi:HAD superfamily hydrolase (TIGR01459 family)
LSPPLLHHFAEIAPAYDVILSDVWGVVHNGVIATAPACAALKRFRDAGGTVILISNAPRPGAVVVRTTLKAMGVPPDCYDAIVTSGDVTRAMLAEKPGARLWHLGPDRDLPIYEGLDVARVGLEAADLSVCSGPFDDETETVGDYATTFEAMLARRLPMICANPDLVVERGDKLIICAGSLADAYRDLGGPVAYAGKPHRPIYDMALALAAATRGGAVSPSRVLAVGDALRTDLAGAQGQGLAALFVTSGIHAHEFGARETPDAARVADVLARAGLCPVASTPALMW